MSLTKEQLKKAGESNWRRTYDDFYISPEVENNKIKEINKTPVTSEQLNNEYWFAKTIDELFVFIDENIKEEPFEKVLEFNETYGFPEYIYFNREEMLVDEEMGYTISSFNID